MSDTSSNTVREFEQLLDPVTSTHFFAEYFEKAPLVLNRSNTHFYNNIINLTDLDTYFYQSVNTESLQVMDESKLVHNEKWTTTSTASDASVTVVDQHKLWAQLRMGRSMRISGAQNYIASLERFCSSVANDLQFRVNANIYITPPSATALKAHYDTHDVLVLQISGEKQWRFYDSPVVRPGPQQPFDQLDYEVKQPSNEFMLSPGDLAYIPRGLVHQAESLDTTSVHVSLGLHYNVVHNLFDELASRFQNNEAFRQALPHGYSSDRERNEFAVEIGRLIQQALPSFTIDEAIDQSERARQPSVPAQSFSETLASPLLCNGALLQRNFSAKHNLIREKSRIRLLVNEDTIDIPILFEPLLDTLLGDMPFSLSDWQVLASEKTKQDLAKRLIEAGFLTFFHEPDYAG